MMADYVVVPKSSMDATADAIREKTGSQSDIEWTQDGFADAIEEIEAGYSANNIASRSISGGITITTQLIDKFAFYGCTSITSISAPNTLKIEDSAFMNCSGLNGHGIFPLVSEAAGNSFYHTGYTTLELPSLAWIAWGGICRSSSNIELLRIGHSTTSLSGTDQMGDSWFRDCSKLNKIIFGWTNKIVKLAGVAAFNNTPFASGGTGGTIYIPESLYDHLGDGTSLDYKSNTNWAAVDAYGTITWAKIEGSQYENYYADGTSIGGGS